MRFEARELKPFAESISQADLEEGEVYFSVTFVDDAMLIPALEPLVFIGMDLEAGDSGLAYFQDTESFRRGIRYHQAIGDSHAKFLVGLAENLSHIFHYEDALNVLLGCSLRRRKRQK